MLRKFLLLLMPIVLFFIPVHWLNGQDTICLFKNLTGSNCYGCGMTRAILSAVHFQFEAAYQYNKMFMLVLPLLIYLWGKATLTAFEIRIRLNNVSIK